MDTHTTTTDEAAGRSAPAEIEPPEIERAQPGSVHPVVIEIGIAAALWFLAVTWLSFAWGREVDLDLAVVTLFFVIFFTLFLLTASYAVKDPRWQLPVQSFAAFLKNENIEIDTGEMRGRDVLLEVALIPVSLAFAATLIGLAWVLFG
jgi:hypothetical protein